ncbi:MAG: AAA family ATPase [Tissierellaceae bacterium]|nr:AAA family ATPase [Tissierellaceae bacterium]
MVIKVKYIEKVILKNFQSHKHTVIEFDNRLNVIVGPSDSGKTAVLRGIRWVLYNEPTGDYFIREGEKESSVTIEFNNGIKIIRARSKSKNTYTMYDSKGKETVFEGFGTTVPEEIIDATEIHKILLDRDVAKSINLSDQLEGAFLLSERPSIRSNSIGRLVGVNIIDDALRETLKDSRNLSVNKKNTEEQLSDLQKELSQYEYLDEIILKLEKVNSIKEIISRKGNKLDKYKLLLTKLLNIRNDKLETLGVLEKLSYMDMLANIIDNVTKKISKYDYFKIKLNSLNNIIHNKDKNLMIANSLRNIDEAERNLNSINSLFNKTIQLSNYNNKFKELKLEIKNNNFIYTKLEYLSTVHSNLEIIGNKYNNLQLLKKIVEKKDSITKSIAIGKRYMDRLKTTDELQTLTSELNIKIKSLLELKGLHENYKLNNNAIYTMVANVQAHKEYMEKYISQYEELLLKQEVCPLCFSTIDEHKIKHIMDHYN